MNTNFYISLCLYKIIFYIIAGFVDGVIISMTMPLFLSIIDKATMNSGRRKEGIYQRIITDCLALN